MPKKIAIIGGGFAGTMVIRQLIDHGFNGSIHLFHLGEKISCGPAYSESNTHLLLNVRAAKMSAFPDTPDHFLQFLHDKFPKEANPSAFTSRSLFGAYLQHIWEETCAKAHENNIDLRVYKEAFRTDSDYTAVVLATGNELPRIPKVISSDVEKSGYFHGNPWSMDWRSTDSDKPIFILGNGLTMVDTVIKLREAGATQNIIALSRHGYNMLAHPVCIEKQTFQIPNRASLQELIAFFKQKRKELESNDFLQLIDACRPYISKWWQGFSQFEQAFFMRHLRHIWGTVRHRIPVEIALKIQEERDSKSLSVAAGKLLSAEIRENSLWIDYLEQGKKMTLNCSCMINCTGPETSIEDMTNPTIRAFLAKDWIRADQTKQGVQLDPERHLVKGNATFPIYAIGNLCKGTFWESTAIGEIRSQAKLIAKDILQ